MSEALKQLADSAWTGTGELWLDPLGDDPTDFACSAQLTDGGLSYRWQKEDDPKEGSLRWTDTGGHFRDSFHQGEEVACTQISDARSEVALTYNYSAGGTDWGWNIRLSLRPNEQLVVQMTNIAPWGEEARAMRMIMERVG